jgi:DNA-binding winged helix-turn-helix (wHTH) protein/tetratricopeptide (TPR) repeat protein
MADEPGVLYEFGPFQVDPDRQLLLCGSESVPITPKAFEMLLILLRHNREVVTKDELMKALWPDSFVEETNLSQNIFRLRKALGDAPGDQRYIVTIPGRGYRFTAQVRSVNRKDGLASEDLVIASRSRSEVVFEQAEAPAQPVLSLPAPVRRRMTLRYLLPICALLVLLIAGSVFFLRRNQRVPEETQSVLVADFTNSTGEPVFDSALRQGLEVQLQQSPYLILVSEDQIQQTLRLMGRPPEIQVTGQVAREVCVRTGTAAVLEGSIQNVGVQYVLSLRSTDCRTGNVIDREQTQVSRKEEVLDAITRMTRAFRKRLGESGATLQQHDVPLAEATTASIDALKSYSLGLEAVNSKGGDAGIPFFIHAVELDPKFAMAYAWLGLEYGASGSSGLATENIRKAYELSNHVSDNERFFIAAYYQGRATGNQEKARHICEEWASVYPREPLPHAFLAGFIYPALANYDKAIEEARKGIEIAPDRGVFYFLLAEDSLSVGRVNDSEETLRKASERKIEYSKLLTVQYDLAFYKDDREGMQQAVKSAQGKPDSMDWIADRQAAALAYSGRLQEARVLSRQAIELAQHQGDPERAAQFAIRSALWEAFFGNARQAKQGAATGLGLARNREVEYGAAVAVGLAGDSKQAQTLADHLESGFPEDTSIRFSYLPVIHAILALNRGDSAAAITSLEPATPYELGSPRCAVVGYYGSLYPIMLRGEAYLAAHKGPEAAREFEKLLDHREFMIGDPVSALARYGLARSYALSGDVNNARIQYKEFLVLWKDADPDLPILKEAKAEFAKLQI